MTSRRVHTHTYIYARLESIALIISLRQKIHNKYIIHSEHNKSLAARTQTATPKGEGSEGGRRIDSWTIREKQGEAEEIGSKACITRKVNHTSHYPRDHVKDKHAYVTADRDHQNHTSPSMILYPHGRLKQILERSN